MEEEEEEKEKGGKNNPCIDRRPCLCHHPTNSTLLKHNPGLTQQWQLDLGWDDQSLVCSRDEKKSSTVRSRSCSCNLRPPVMCILSRTTNSWHRNSTTDKVLALFLHRFFSEARNKATFDPVQCLLSRQAGSSNVMTFNTEELPPNRGLFYRGGGGVGPAWTWRAWIPRCSLDWEKNGRKTSLGRALRC